MITDKILFEYECKDIEYEAEKDQHYIHKIPCVKYTKMIYIDQCDCFQNHKDKTIKFNAYCTLFDFCSKRNMRR